MAEDFRARGIGSGVEVVSARSYISDTHYNRMRGAKIFNLCKSYRYQSLGYYVSLLAEARGHKPLPSITTALRAPAARSAAPWIEFFLMK